MITSRFAETSLDKKMVATEEAIAATKRRLTTLEISKFNIARKTPILCSWCEIASAIKRWGFIQKKHFVHPTDGNEEGEWIPSSIEVCSLVCPRCKRVTDLYRHHQKLQILTIKEKIMDFHGLFASVKEERVE